MQTSNINYRCALLFSMSLKAFIPFLVFLKKFHKRSPNEKLILDRIEYLKQFLSLAELNAVDLWKTISFYDRIALNIISNFINIYI